MIYFINEGAVMMDMFFTPLGDSAVTIDFGEGISLEKNRKILNMAKAISRKPFRGFLEVVPAYTTLTVFYNPIEVGGDYPYERVCKQLKERIYEEYQYEHQHRKVRVPVCYDEEFGPDLEEVAEANGLSVEKVIEIHSSRSYHVYFLGFAPGFPFLGGMDPTIATPRKKSPRLKVPAGSVGIAGKQTGIYPIETPGGWQIIGRTPIPLFHPDQHPPTLLLPGDEVQFVPITKDIYENWEEQTWQFTSQEEDY